MDDTVQSCLKGLFRKGSALGTTLSSTMGDKAELFELAAFVTLPGADRQVVHADTLFTKQPALFTVALALQDITEDMGPTLFFPGTHTKPMHRLFDNAKTKDQLLLKTPHKLSLLQTGDIHVYDSRCLHCGTPNQSDRPRVLFYASFRNPRAGKQGEDFWNVASLRPEYAGQYTLKQFMS
jgi:ectoine hydroxylase-related dioxygenase (phytanoyl-CoA dioxygenase family)